MTWTPPTLIVKAALASGPVDDINDISSGAWTDLSSRVCGVARCKRGRNDVRAQFGAGTCTITLDNSDRMLDPLNPSGLVYHLDGEGLPLCPVTVDWSWDGNTYRAFTGYLGPQAWPATTAPHGTKATVELQVTDKAGWSPGLPADAWGVMLAALQPDWWLRMDGGFPVVADDSVIPNRTPAGGGAFMVSPSGISRYEDGLQSWEGQAPSLRIVSDNVVVSNANDIMPDGNELNMTIMFLWNATAAVPTGETARVAAMFYPGGTSTKRWQVYLDDDGEAHAATYDAGGTLIATDIIDRTGSAVSRFDDQNTHLVIIRFTSGNNMDVWFGGLSLDSGTLTAAAAVYESDLIIGGAGMDMQYDELVILRRALTDTVIDGILLAGDASQAKPWHGDDWNDRLSHWFEAAGLTPDIDDTEQWHMPSPDPDDGMFGLDANSGLPATLAQAIQLVAEWSGGSAWVTKDGYWRVRSLDALTDVAYAAEYATTSAVFTDEDGTLGAGEYRHAGIEPRGSDIDQIVNSVAASFSVRANPPSDVSERRFTITPRNEDSIARYGIRADSFTSKWWGWAMNAHVADTIVESWGTPQPGIETIHLDALADDDVTQWIIETCELELAVDAVYTPFGATARTFTGLNIQSIEWTLTTENLTCDLTVARS